MDDADGDDPPGEQMVNPPPTQPSPRRSPDSPYWSAIAACEPGAPDTGGTMSQPPQQPPVGRAEMDPTAEEVELLQSAFDHARSGDAESLHDLLDAGLPSNLTNTKGDTLLILAAYHQQAEVVSLLLQHGADHGRVNDNGQTALAAAVFRQDEQIVRELLSAGADPERGERSAVMIADFFDLPAMRALLDRS
jgi:uncharacterized protein